VAYADFRHRVPLRVRWAEVDLQGVVFNGHYLAYADVCVTEYWRAIGMVYPNAFLAIGTDLFVRKATLEYHAPAHYDAQLEICGRTSRFGTTSLTFRVEMFALGELDHALVEADLVYVCTDPVSKTPQRLPAMLRQRVLSYEQTAPTGAAVHAED
jgi:acyl-CoA thioester hydrolase